MDWAKTGELLADASMTPTEETESIATKRAMRVVDREVIGIWLSNPGGTPSELATFNPD
jgi:hypothetical protein